ncbi:MAG: ATP-grasp domain-containing protein [Thermoproteota archaeon]
MVFRLSREERFKLIQEVNLLRKEVEDRLTPLGHLDAKKPVTFLSIGGGELGDLTITTAKRNFGGILGGIKTVAFDRYFGFPAQDMADAYECFNLMDGKKLRESIKKYIPDPTEPHAIYLEVEMIDTLETYKLGMDEGYRIISTPYSPLVCMDRHATKLMLDRLNLERVDWIYASNEEEVRKAARDLNLPVIVKPVMTSSGHGTSIVKTKEELEHAYSHAVAHARGAGDEVIVERYLPELKENGTEITQIVVRHFNEHGKIVDSFLPPIEHRRPGATYHESWLPATISEVAKAKCREDAKKIADFLGGLGVYAVEQFVMGNKVLSNEVANRPHDTGLITRWMLNMDEGGLHLISSLGLNVTPNHVDFSRKNVFGVAHVVLAPENIEGEVEVLSWEPRKINSFQISNGIAGDFWYFGKPKAYAGRRMGLAVAFDESLENARRNAELLAHFAEKCIVYGGK